MTSGPEGAGPLASPGFWLHRAALAWLQDLDQRLRPLGLTHTQFVMLAAISWLAVSQGVPTQQEVATFAGADRMMTSRVVRGLIQRGLVSREPDAHDARAVRLTITQPGQDLVSKAVRAAAQTDEMFFGTGHARQQLRDKLASLAEHKLSLEAEPPHPPTRRSSPPRASKL
ncbi:MAG TPA: MarR family transcriptional regulator [Streptosporangiaceae bacterium]|nr:MarR family transcriptional regulator [Streptosporangiaceae bacterium]